METTIKKDELLAILKENKTRHREVYEAAFAGFQKEAKRVLRAQLRDLNAGRVRELRVLLNCPQDHSQGYDRMIRMVELDVGDVFTLSEQRFAQLVMDDWDWKRAWLKMSSRYAAAETYSNYGVIDDDD